MKKRLRELTGTHFGTLLLATVLIGVGCMHQPNGGTGRIEGQYNLVAVNGKALPAEVSHHGTPVNVRSGSFAFSLDGSCASETVFASPSGKEMTRRVSGTYTGSGTNLQMRWKGAGQTSGKVDGDTFTLNNEGMHFDYRN